MVTIYRNGINVIGVRICKDPPWACFYHEIHWHQYWYLEGTRWFSDSDELSERDTNEARGVQHTRKEVILKGSLSRPSSSFRL